MTDIRGSGLPAIQDLTKPVAPELSPLSNHYLEAVEYQTSLWNEKGGRVSLGILSRPLLTPQSSL